MNTNSPAAPNPSFETAAHPSTETLRPGSLLAVIGGKGGVGKTNIATNVAVAAARMQARVLLLDGDLGLANVDVLLGLTPRCTAAEILSGECDFTDAIVTGPGGVHVIPAASARMDLAAAGPTQLTSLLAPLLSAGFVYDLVVVDVGAGVGPSVISLASVCDRAWLVTTPEPTSVTDAYGTLKVLSRVAPSLPIELLVNCARSETQARSTHRQLEQVARRFLDVGVSMRGSVPRDVRVEDAVAIQKPLVENFPTSAAARKIVHLADQLLAELPIASHRQEPTASHRAPASVLQRKPAVPNETWRKVES